MGERQREAHRLFLEVGRREVTAVGGLTIEEILAQPLEPPGRPARMGGVTPVILCRATRHARRGSLQEQHPAPGLSKFL